MLVTFCWNQESDNLLMRGQPLAPDPLATTFCITEMVSEFQVTDRFIFAGFQELYYIQKNWVTHGKDCNPTFLRYQAIM